jgi:hypothetical protein
MAANNKKKIHLYHSSLFLLVSLLQLSVPPSTPACLFCPPPRFDSLLLCCVLRPKSLGVVVLVPPKLLARCSSYPMMEEKK